MPFALDFGAIMTMGGARRVDLDLLAATLPAAEAAILASHREAPDEPEEV